MQKAGEYFTRVPSTEHRDTKIVEQREWERAEMGPAMSELKLRPPELRLDVVRGGAALSLRLAAAAPVTSCSPTYMTTDRR
jgi:hypothetical protein